MAKAGEVTFDVKINGYWQVCPVCGGRGQVPPGFYTGVAGPNTTPDACRRCDRTGTIEVPIVRAAQQEARDA